MFGGFRSPAHLDITNVSDNNLPRRSAMDTASHHVLEPVRHAEAWRMFGQHHAPHALTTERRWRATLSKSRHLTLALGVSMPRPPGRRRPLSLSPPRGVHADAAPTPPAAPGRALRCPARRRSAG